MQAAMQAGEETAPPSTAGPHTATRRTTRRARSNTTLLAISAQVLQTVIMFILFYFESSDFEYTYVYVRQLVQ
jgi:hypothetical protein